MENEFTSEYAKKCREDALRKYDDEKERFAIQLLSMAFYKIKSRLTEEGLKKVLAIDKEREKKDFDENFSKKTWELLEEVWGKSLDRLVSRISVLYGLSDDKDLTNSTLDEKSP